MAQVKHRTGAAQEVASQTSRSFRTFLLLQQFEAEEIGARLSKARTERGLTQEELAEMASFSKRSLQDYEGGVTIPYRHLREFSKLLGKPTEWFLYGDAGAAPPDSKFDQLIEQVAGMAARVEALREEVAELRAERGGQPPAHEASS